MRVTVIVFLLTISFCASEDEPWVSTPSGKIIGYYKISFEGNKYEAYEGIPYALPPTGDRRFKPPEPIRKQSSNVTIVANKLTNHCLEYERITFPSGGHVRGEEDCLYLHLYAPIKKNNIPLPVIFWIHGGAFQYGTVFEDEAHYLMDHDVVYISVNYRLGILGFLSTEDGVVSGNMGLKDQVAALRWVKNNVQYFGGDPDRITLMGLSAGGASVHYHYLSPMTAGLFHSGISFSGTALDCWTQTENSREKAVKLGELMGCPINDIRAMIRCLKGIPANELVEAQVHFMPWRLNPFTPFGPVVEKFAENPFIDQTPIEIIKNGKVHDLPWVVTVVSEEGLYPLTEYITKDEALEDIDENWESIAPYLLDYYYTIPKDKHNSTAKLIRQHYFGDEPIGKKNIRTLTHLVGDRMFIIDAEKAARAQAEVNQSPVFFYYYSYRASTSISESETGSTQDFGVCHGDDVYLVQKNPLVIPTKTAADMAMHNKLVRIWRSVASKSIPKIDQQWLRVNPTKNPFKYLHIRGPFNLKMESNNNLADKLFWETIDFNENKIHYTST